MRVDRRGENKGTGGEKTPKLLGAAGGNGRLHFVKQLREN